MWCRSFLRRLLKRVSLFSQSPLLPTLGKMLREKIDERFFLGCVLESRTLGAAALRVFHLDRGPILHVSRNENRMHVRFSADCGRVMELRRDETNILCHGFLPRVLVRRFTKISENSRHPERAAPRSEILDRVGKLSELSQIIVYVARADIEPITVLLVAE